MMGLTSSVKPMPNGSREASMHQSYMNGHSKGDLSKLPNDVFNMLPEYFSAKDMARFLCVSKEKQRGLNEIAQKVNKRLREKLNQKILQTKIDGIQISPGPRNVIQEMNVLEMQNKAIDVLEAKNIKDINASDSNGDTSLHWAARNGDSTVVDVLIAVGANVNMNMVNDIGDTPLHWAARNGDLTVVKALIAAGATVNRVSYYGDYPLHKAVSNGDATVINVLIAAGGNMDIASEFGWTPLHYVAHIGNLEIANLLINKGADINVTDSNGSTPLHLARRKNASTVVEALIAAGANANVDIVDMLTQKLLSL